MLETNFPRHKNNLGGTEIIGGNCPDCPPRLWVWL